MFLQLATSYLTQNFDCQPVEGDVTCVEAV